jgi:hypothetical protein
MRGIFGRDKSLLAPEKGLCSVEFDYDDNDD